MAEKVGIEINLINADGAYNTLKEIESTMKRLGAKKTKIQMEDGSLVSVDERIKKIQDRLAALNAAKKVGVITPEETREAQRLSAELNVIKRGMRDATANAKTFKQVFNSISSKAAHIGSAMQSFGNAMTQLTSPFRRLTSGVLMGAGFKAFDSFTEGLERGFSRYDTMKKYPKIMAAFGYTAAEAEESIKALDLSVRGLPTGLDEMVDLAQRFTATTGDIQKGTKLAIATNNAFLASMSTDTQRYQGMMQLQDVLGGKDMNAREWNSLVSSMTPAIVKMGEAMKESGEWSGSIGDFIQYIRDGKMDNQKFIDQLIKIGNEGGVLEKMAQESKNTWQAFFANVGNAASRMTAGVIQSLDEVVKTFNLTDKNGVAIDSVNMLLSNKIIPAIDSATESAKKWIQAHPDAITNFFKNLSQIKVGNFLRGYAKGLELMVGLVEKLATALGKHPQLMGFLGGFFGVGGTLGRMSTIGGGLLKGTRHIWGGIGAAGSWLFKGKLGGLFGKIASIFGKKKDIQAAGETAKTIPSVADTFKSAFGALKGLITAAGAVTLVAGTGFVTFKAAKSILTDLKDMVDLVNGGGWDNVGYVASGVIVAIGAFTEIFNAIGTALGPQGLLGVAIASAATLFVGGAFAGNMRLIKDGIKSIHDTILEIDKVGSAITNMKGLAGINTGAGGKLQASVNAIREIVNVMNGKNGGPADRGEYSQGLPMFTEFRAAALTNIANAITQMQRIVEGFNKLAGLTVNDPSEVIGKIKEACDKLQGIHGPRTLLKDTTKVADALIQIRRMAYHINKMAGTSVDTGGFAAFVEQIKTALSDLSSLSQTLELDIKVVLGAGFSSSVNGVVKQINSARTRINNAMKKIPNAITKHISVTITASVNTRQAVAAITSGAEAVKSMVPNATPAKGGLIYRAKGGSIPWRRRGTDTVPAMLTPGEYVHNKRAVSAFGIDFMRKVNNLDMKGAMNELMHRAGHMANINRGTTITNNYNNNQKVVINNSNAGAGFTFKSASRFVGAF